MTATQVAACAEEAADEEESVALQRALQRGVVVDQDSPDNDDDTGAVSTDTDMAGVAQGLSLTTSATASTPLPNLQANMMAQQEHPGWEGYGSARPKCQGDEPSQERKRSQSRDKAEAAAGSAGDSALAKPADDDVIVMDGQDLIPQPMTWLPAMGAFLPVHIAIKDADKFLYWAKCLNIDHLSLEVWSL